MIYHVFWRHNYASDKAIHTCCNRNKHKHAQRMKEKVFTTKRGPILTMSGTVLVVVERNERD